MYAQYIQKPKDVPEKTDLKNWRLDVDKGRQVWRYVSENAERLQRVCEKYFLGLDISEDCPPLKIPTNPLESARNAIDFYSKIQTEDGHWANDYGGPLFLLPGLVITCYVSKTLFEEPQKKEMIRYLSNIQHEDGGWGLHLEDKSTIFGTAMNYVALRLLGLERDDERIKKAREFLHNNDGAKGIPSWGKFWLCALGVYEWEGMNAVPPELWLLPNWLPMHPGRWWCHCRVVYLPMGYIYGKRARPEPTPLILSLREELYTEPYDKIKWSSLRGYVSSLDVYTPHSTLNKITFSIVNFYESFHSKWIREKALSLCIDHIRQEDINTKHIDIGPVNKVINMLSIFWDEGPESENFKKHQERVKDYLWLSSDGMKMQGYNGSQLWDTAFSVQAIIETGLSEEFKETMIKASKFVDCAQVLEDVQDKEKYYRHISKGAWPFSTRDHGWPISDCTAEGLKASLLLKKHCKFTEPLSDERLYDAVNVILSLQNKDGGWATYELKRGPDWVELLNPAEVFYGIMVDYSYVECTSACVQALCLFRRFFPHHRSEEIKKSIEKGIDFILGIQRKDGSWLGSWAVCFTYAIWFGVEALVDFGHEYETSEPLQKAFKFLLEKQNKDGGWGETFQSCVKKEWCQNEKSQVVNTSWVVLSLLKANYHKIDSKPIDRAIDFLMKTQEKNGDWTQEDIKGVFNANCAISYSGYKNIFPIWALGRYNRKCGKKYSKSNL